MGLKMVFCPSLVGKYGETALIDFLQQRGQQHERPTP